MTGKSEVFPVLTRQASSLVCGRHTDFVASRYDGLVFVIVTQKGKIGSLFRVTQEPSQSGEDVDSLAGVNVRCLLGKRDSPVLDVFASQIARVISGLTVAKRGEGDNNVIISAQDEQMDEANPSKTIRPTLVSLCLENEDAATFREILAMLEEVRVW